MTLLPKAKDQNDRQESSKILGQPHLFTYHLGAISFDETQISKTVSHNKTPNEKTDIFPTINSKAFDL